MIPPITELLVRKICQGERPADPEAKKPRKGDGWVRIVDIWWQGGRCGTEGAGPGTGPWCPATNSFVTVGKHLP